jgi:signal transduction histidine kinase
MSDSPLVLIVDDTPANLGVICAALEQAGFEIAIATSGERALQQVTRELPDVILMDVMMPGIDGFETCQQLKNNPLTAAVPVIFMTALADAEYKVKALAMGAVDYVTKPFQTTEVIARVSNHLQLYRLTQQLEQRVTAATAELQTAHLQMIQSEKMSVLGNLVAGVAHEINNPLGFLSGSLEHTHQYISHILQHLQLYQQAYPEPPSAIQTHAQAIELEFLTQDIPQLLNSMTLATERMTQLSTSLRTFSRAETTVPMLSQLQDGLNSTLILLKYRLQANPNRPEIQVVQEHGDLPAITCILGQLNQVFMNILANAIDAIDEIAQGRSYQENADQGYQITLRTWVEADGVNIAIGDNGPGMTAAVQAKIFDHLFTTKGAGKGTGLGLAIAQQIIVAGHSGKIVVNSTLGQGTEFVMTLPLSP